MYTGGFLGGVKKSSSGQAPLLAGILFLLLIPTTIIIAENVTNNLTGDMIANFSLKNITENATSETPPENNQTGNDVFFENETLPVTGTNTAGYNNGTDDGRSNTLPIEINDTPPWENITVNITPAVNETNITLPGNATNTTMPDNETVHEHANETQEPKEPESQGPILDISIEVPERANRNEPFLLSAEITNTGDTDALDVEVEWVIPDGISILEGSGSHYCDVPAGAACTSDLKVAASLSSELGEREIKVLVRYFE